MRGIKSAVAAALLVASTAATAVETVTVQWAASIFSPPGARNVGTVTFPSGSSQTDAGRFHGAVTATSAGFDPGQLVDSAANFYAYCHDLAQTIGGGTTYNVSYGASATMLDFLGAVNAVIGGGDDYDWLRPSDSLTAAAIQLGIWEALHNDNFVLNSGAVTFSSVQGDVQAQFQLFVNAMAGSTDLDGSRVMTLTHYQRQDVITGRFPPGKLVPEPTTLLLLGMAAAAAGVARRRMR